VIFAAFGCREKKPPDATTADRIITISPNITEIAFALGLGEKIIAVSSDSDWPAEAKGKIKVGSFWQPNIEAVIAAKPDLVITETFEQHKTIADNLECLNIRVLSLKIESIDEMVDAIRQTGDATGVRQAAEETAERILSKIEGIRKKFAGRDRPKVLWVIQAEPLRVAGQKTFINEIIEIAGGENCLGKTIQQYPQIGDEELLTNPADVIIHSAMGKASMEEQQKEAEVFWLKYKNLPAVKNKRIYVVNSDIVLRLGPRLPEGIETVARLLHPEEFSGKDSVNKDLK
jgi:iron complex transport system substrate-binding protein